MAKMVKTTMKMAKSVKTTKLAKMVKTMKMAKTKMVKTTKIANSAETTEMVILWKNQSTPPLSWSSILRYYAVASSLKAIRNGVNRSETALGSAWALQFFYATSIVRVVCQYTCNVCMLCVCTFMYTHVHV